MNILHLPIIDSTQLHAKRWLAENETHEITALLADEQTQGKGQWNREWTSLPGNLFVTYIVPIRLLQNTPNLAPMGLRVAEALCHELSTYPLCVKWPNDLFLNQQKCGGILCEVENQYLLIGVGLNIANAPPGKSFLNMHDHYPETPHTLCKRLGERILKIDFTLPWQLPHLMYQNEWIDYTPPNGEPFDVYVEGLSPDGALKARGKNGILVEFQAGRLGLAGTRT